MPYSSPSGFSLLVCLLERYRLAWPEKHVINVFEEDQESILCFSILKFFGIWIVILECLNAE